MWSKAWYVRLGSKGDTRRYGYLNLPSQSHDDNYLIENTPGGPVSLRLYGHGSRPTYHRV